MFWLVIIQIIGLAAASAAAIVDIESIVYSGPLLSASGILIAILAYRRNRPACLYYALATPTMSVLCFAIIYGLNWSPQRAQIPIGVLVGIFSLTSLPFGIVALGELRRREVIERRTGPFQFSITAIMCLTLVVALSLSLFKTLGQPGIALASILCHTTLLAYVLRQFHSSRAAHSRSKLRG